MAKKISNIVIMMGGNSSEYDISINSGKEVVKNLDPKKYNILPVIIKKDYWLPVSKEKLLSSNSKTTALQNIKKNSLSMENVFKNTKIDACFLALHGKFGEDGTVQALLEFLKIPYTGSGVLASALGMDKIRARKIFKEAGLVTPKTIVLEKGESTASKLKTIKFPVVVKPNSHGSSVGVLIAHNKTELKKAISKSFKIDDTVLVEEYIKGTEVTCAVLGNKKLKALPVVEIVPKTEFFDFEAKYTPSKCDEIVPARISKELTKKVQSIAIVAFKTIGCRGFARVDMIIKNKKIYVLEINTIPGLTKNSLLPKAAKSANISFSKLLDKILDFSVQS